MAKDLIIIGDTGKVFHVTLKDKAVVEELPPENPTTAAAENKAADGAIIAEITEATERRPGSAGVAGIIMGTLVNLSRLLAGAKK